MAHREINKCGRCLHFPHRCRLRIQPIDCFQKKSGGLHKSFKWTNGQYLRCNYQETFDTAQTDLNEEWMKKRSPEVDFYLSMEICLLLSNLVSENWQTFVQWQLNYEFIWCALLALAFGSIMTNKIKIQGINAQSSGVTIKIEIFTHCKKVYGTGQDVLLARKGGFRCLLEALH